MEAIYTVSTDQYMELRDLRSAVYRRSDALTDIDCKAVYNECVKAMGGFESPSAVIFGTRAFLASLDTHVTTHVIPPAGDPFSAGTVWPVTPQPEAGLVECTNRYNEWLGTQGVEMGEI